jgi:hypothetical protein
LKVDSQFASSGASIALVVDFVNTALCPLDAYAHCII